LNRLSLLKYPEYLIEMITGNLVVEDDGTPFLKFQNERSLYLAFHITHFNNYFSIGCFFFIDGVYKIWFPTDEDRRTFASGINKLIMTERLSKACEVEELNQVGFAFKKKNVNLISY
jgi:hypothetical protein